MGGAVLSLGLIRLSLDTIVRTPFFPHHREGYDDGTSRPHRRRGAGGYHRSPRRSRRMAGQAVLTTPAPRRPLPLPAGALPRPLPLEVQVPSVTTCAVMMGRGHPWCFGNEDFREQQQP